MQYSVQRDALEGRETDGVVSCEVFASVSARLMALLLLPSEWMNGRWESLNTAVTATRCVSGCYWLLKATTRQKFTNYKCANALNMSISKYIFTASRRNQFTFILKQCVSTVLCCVCPYALYAIRKKVNFTDLLCSTVSAQTVGNQMVPPCAEWWCETENRATTSFGYGSSTASLPVRPQCVNVRRSRRQADLNIFPHGELEETTGTPPYNEQSNWCGSESSTLENDVYVWHYALIVVHARNEWMNEWMCAEYITKTCSSPEWSNNSLKHNHEHASKLTSTKC